MWMLVAVIAAQATAQPALPEWMAGCWEQRAGERWTEECWSTARGGIMIGYSRSGEGGVLDLWEVMQIELVETDDPVIEPLIFWASPSGTARTKFAWVRSSEPGVTFVNLGNAYPQRIRYWREGRFLIAEIALADGSKRRRWRYSPLNQAASAALSARMVRPLLPTSAKPPLTAIRWGAEPAVR